jgi:carboxymethylenebutenolidase
MKSNMVLDRQARRRFMTASSVEIETQDGVCDAYISHPNTTGLFPAVLMFMDGFGLRPVVKEIADRIAAAGYFVLLPNMYYRSGRAPLFEVAEILESKDFARLMKMVDAVTPERVARDGTAFLDFLNQQAHVRAGAKIGLAGYCMGVTHLMQTAANFPDRIAAGAGFHGGRLATEAPQSPHLLAPRIKAELYFGHADADPHLTPEQGQTLNRALDTAGVTYKAEVYPGALHGYTMSDLPVFNAAAREHHFEHMLALFARTLGGSTA